MTVESQYASALCQIPRVDWDHLLEKIEKVVENPHFQAALNTPFTRSETLFELLNACLSGLNQKQKNFVYLLTKNKRLAEIKQIRETYQCLQRIKKKEQVVTITTALKATPAQRKMLETYAQKYITNGMTPSFSYQESAAVIGGFILRINNYIIDQSIAKRLDYISEFIEGDHLWQHN